MVSTDLVVCPSCDALLHAEELRRLAEEAASATARGDLTGALTAWRKTLVLLPAAARQYAVVMERIRDLSAQLDGRAPAMPVPAPDAGASKAGGSKIPKPLAALGGFGVLLWKAKFLVVLILSKGKLLLLGLTKASTLLSMALTFGVYWRIFGWKWALGVVITTYIHEMGHVAALRRYGIHATAPMFVPGLGAFVRLNQGPASVHEDARVGLAGPVWGAAAAVGCAAIYLMTDIKAFAATAVVASWINLFNLLPIPPLDGGRGFRALSRPFRLMVGAVTFGAGLWANESGLLMVIGGIGLVRGLSKDAPAEGDELTLGTFIVLVATLASILVLLGDSSNSRFMPTVN
jgi:Zn-dependent protease